jgi:hypothetical protein
MTGLERITAFAASIAVGVGLGSAGVPVWSAGLLGAAVWFGLSTVCLSIERARR